MTIDEAIKQAEAIADYDCYNEKQIKQAEAYRQLAEWLIELKQLREQIRWIPVTERLPEKSGYYWCTFGGTNLTGSDYYTTESDAKEIYDEPEEYVGWRSQNVVAWMPKPKPYSEVIKNDR